MAQYYIDVTMTHFGITTNRAPQGDDPYFYWNVRLMEGGYDRNGHLRPPVDVQTAKLHIVIGPQKAPTGYDPGTLRGVTPAFWANPTNPFKEPLTARFTANETQYLAIS
jgi:hypothetical protein